jgi:deazaflavin-dependent oxidoreductase (nitroreductase family)
MPTHPNWFHNLTADPHVHVQAGSTKTAALARTAEGEERDRLWKLMTAIWPNFDTYQTRTDRVIPVVVLEPTS